MKIYLPFCLILLLSSCVNNPSTEEKTSTADTPKDRTIHPSDVLPFVNEMKILLGDGVTINKLKDYQSSKYFYVDQAHPDWVVYKTPNAGITSRNSSNTRTELHHRKEWTPEEGGKLTGTLKVMQVSTTGDARVAASYSTVVGQIHSGEGHENEPLKIFYKKFPGHDKGSVFWNYEINTAGPSNDKRWDYSYPIWGYDMSVVGDTPDTYPAEPKDGIHLGEEFSYVVNVYKGMMHLTFTAEGHGTKTFTKNLIESEYTTPADLPEQTAKLFGQIGRDGTERTEAYSGELQYFKQGAYNQTNGKSPESNMVWCSGADIYDGDLDKQYANGSYTEVWFSKGTVGPGTPVGQ